MKRESTKRRRRLGSQVNRLKLLKRQGYRRVDVGLLRQRVMQAA